MPQINLPHNLKDGTIAFAVQVMNNLNAIRDAINNGLTSDNYADNSVTDDKIGNRTVDQGTTTAYSNTGKLTQILSWFAKMLKTITGRTNWYDAPPDNLTGLDSRTSSNTAEIATLKSRATTIENNLATHNHDSRYYTETEIDQFNSNINSSIAAVQSALNNHRGSNDHDDRYYTKAELTPYLQGGDTLIKEEVFTIINADNGDGTFTYSDNNRLYQGIITDEGYQVFYLNKGQYTPGLNRIEVIINDTLRRSSSSGGLIEIDPVSVGVSPEGNGAEITIKYYERIGLTGEHNLIIGEVQPPQSEGNTVWFKVLS